MTGRWQPDDEHEAEEGEEMARKMRAYNRILGYFVIAPVIGIGCILLTWGGAGSGAPLPESKWFFLVVLAGPALLWFASVRLVLSAMMMDDDQLRTEEEDERQQRLWRQYKRGGLLDVIGVMLGLAHWGL